MAKTHIEPWLANLWPKVVAKAMFKHGIRTEVKVKKLDAGKSCPWCKVSLKENDYCNECGIEVTCG